MLKSKVRQTKQSAHPLSWGGGSVFFLLVQPSPIVQPSPTGPPLAHWSSRYSQLTASGHLSSSLHPVRWDPRLLQRGEPRARALFSGTVGRWGLERPQYHPSWPLSGPRLGEAPPPLPLRAPGPLLTASPAPSPAGSPPSAGSTSPGRSPQPSAARPQRLHSEDAAPL